MLMQLLPFFFLEHLDMKSVQVTQGMIKRPRGITIARFLHTTLTTLMLLPASLKCNESIPSSIDTKKLDLLGLGPQ